MNRPVLEASPGPGVPQLSRDSGTDSHKGSNPESHPPGLSTCLSIPPPVTLGHQPQPLPWEAGAPREEP